MFRILFNNDPQQISFNSAKKWLRKWYRNTTFSSKMHNGENAFEVLLYLYKQCKHHTKICIFCIEMDSFWNHVIYVWIVWSFLYMEMSTTQNSLKKIFPSISTSTPPPLKHNDVAAREEVVPNHFNEYLLWSLKYFVREKHNKNMIFKIVSEKHLIKC